MSSSEDPKFELRLIHVDWTGKNDVAGIESARHSIPLQRDPSDESFRAEVPAYPEVDGFGHGQLAVSTDTDTTPRIESAGESIPMDSVLESATGEKWWIEKGEWKSVSSSSVAPGYHDAPSCRHGGTVLLHIGNQRCRVHFTPPGFSKEEFDDLLSDFQDECWQLILSDESYTTAPSEGKSTVPGEDFIEQAREVLQAAKRVLKKPQRELREVQSLQRTSRVRPVPRTFKELSSKGWTRKVTGRDHRPDYDTPENRYVASIIERLLQAVQSLRRGGQARRDRLGRHISWMSKRIDNMKEGVTQVDPSRLENFAEREEKRVQEWRNRSEEIFPVGPSLPALRRRRKSLQEITLTFKATGSDSGYNSITARISEYEFEGSEQKLKKGSTAYLQFKCEFNELEFFGHGSTYEIQIAGTVDNRGDYSVWKVYRVESASLIEDKKTRESKYLRSKANSIRSKEDEDQKKVGLQRRWEREEQKRERQSLQKRTQFYENIRERWTDRLEALRQLQRDLSEVRRQFEQHGIESSLHARYPGTMVFVEQPAYRAAHAAYQDLQGSSGFQSDLFDKLLSLDDLSILDLPTVYERWCLLQIVRVLEEEYGFEPVTENDNDPEPHSSWRSDLVDTVCQTSEQAFTVQFRSTRLQRRTALTYQAELPSGKRPDFLLKIKGKDIREDGRDHWLSEVRIVLDAKFKQYKGTQNGSEDSTLGHELDLLFNEKNYAERNLGRGNSVFVLHPSEGAVPKPATSQNWASSSYYGGGKTFEWQGGFPNHRQGGVLAHPKRRDDLKRLVAMALSYPGEDNHGVYGATNEIAQKRFCVVCGGVDIPQIHTRGAEESKGYWYRCENNQCKHFMVLHFCGNCGHRLWKHGSHWTFHDTHPLSPYNIKCPQCGAYVPVSNEDDDEL